MRLTPENIDLILSGKKKFEIRLNDEKRQMIKIDDEIEFIDTEDFDRSVRVVVTSIITRSSFTELFSVIDLVEAGWPIGTALDEATENMRKYYSVEDERKFGVVAIGIILM